jgi:CheY-like chemotaxis protein
VKLQCRPLDLASAVEHALTVLTSASRTDHIIAPDLQSVAVSADPTRLEQIVLNLMTNALKYTPSGKTIRVTTRAVDGHALLEVADEGVGMTADTIPRIFDLFVQGERTADRAQGGLGIGLTLVQMLTELHGGTVEAASGGPNRGSTFTIRLPRAEIQPSASRPARPAEVVTRRRVLVVEDNDDAREMLKTILQLYGHEVLEATDGAAGLRLAIETHPEVALIDLGLPIMDGLELARQIRRQPLQPGRLIAVTGYGQPEDRRRSLEAGFDDHIVKPVDPVQIAEMIG